MSNWETPSTRTRRYQVRVGIFDTLREKFTGEYSWMLWEDDGMPRLTAEVLEYAEELGED